MGIETLAVGQKAPDFETKNQDGKTIKLSDFRGKKVALYFYPKDDTSGCTKQSCNLRDNHQEMLNRGFVVLGVSADDVASHKDFAEKFQLPFDLLADTSKAIIESYGVWGEKNLYGKKFDGIHRITYIIDEDGMIADVIKKVKTDDHAAQILK